jgi:hypothetical protein
LASLWRRGEEETEETGGYKRGAVPCALYLASGGPACGAAEYFIISPRSFPHAISTSPAAPRFTGGSPVETAGHRLWFS